MSDFDIPPQPPKKEPMLVPPPRKRKHDQEQLDLLTVPKDWQEHWQGMPEFNQQDLTQVKSIQVHLKSLDNLKALSAALGQQITADTRSVWFPKENLDSLKDKHYVDGNPKKKVIPRYPIYVISKGRWESRLTVKSLEQIGIPYHVVIEPQEYEQYAAVVASENILVLPFSNLGQGSIPARNWVWEHSISIGADRHWILDDNIRGFHRLNHNRKFAVNTGATFYACEYFVDRYENVGLAGMNYHFLGSNQRVYNQPAYYQNTRIYSCILIRNDLPYRWRGRYNEDTDLSLRVLKSGMPTVLFQAFKCNKQATMTMKGGNTESLYKLDHEDGRKLMAESLHEQHPDVCKVSFKWGRVQHHVDYSGFKQKLILKPGVIIPQGINEFGMELRYK